MTILLGVSLLSTSPLILTRLNRTVPKFASGSTAPVLDDGASVITSAEDRAKVAFLLTMVCVQWRVVSVSTSVYFAVPLNVTDALMWSPGLTRVLKLTGASGNISYQP